MTKINAYYGFLLIERVGDVRIKHFRKSSAKKIHVAEARIHDLVRSQRWSGERVFEIWDGINPISITTVTKTDAGLVFKKKDYLLQPSDKREAIGYEKDYDLATAYKKKVTLGLRSDDVSQWIKKKPLDRVLCTMVDKRNFRQSTKISQRAFY